MFRTGGGDVELVVVAEERDDAFGIIHFQQVKGFFWHGDAMRSVVENVEKAVEADTVGGELHIGVGPRLIGEGLGLLVADELPAVNRCE